MADGRRTRWVAHDVYFLDDGLGAAMFDRFGASGIALWHGFIAACKKNHIEGEVTFANDADALNIFGLPGMPLVDLDGQEFILDDWLGLLSDHKVIRRSRRARRMKVACTKWTRWQQAARRGRKADAQAAARDEEGEQNTRSDGENIGTVAARSRHDAGPKQAQMTDTDTDTDTDVTHSVASDGFDGFWDAYPKRDGKKVGKGKALIEWKKLKPAERDRAMVAVRNYAASDVIPRDAERFLKRDRAGERFFEDWQEPASSSGRADAELHAEIEANRDNPDYWLGRTG